MFPSCLPTIPAAFSGSEGDKNRRSWGEQAGEVEQGAWRTPGSFVTPLLEPAAVPGWKIPSAAAHLPVQPPRLVHAQVPGALHALDGHGAHGHGADLQQTCGHTEREREGTAVSPALSQPCPVPHPRCLHSLCGLWLPAASTLPSAPMRRKQLKRPCLLAV